MDEVERYVIEGVRESESGESHASDHEKIAVPEDRVALNVSAAGDPPQDSRDILSGRANVERLPSITRAVCDAGHEIGNP